MLQRSLKASLGPRSSAAPPWSPPSRAWPCPAAVALSTLAAAQRTGAQTPSWTLAAVCPRMSMLSTAGARRHRYELSCQADDGVRETSGIVRQPQLLQSEIKAFHSWIDRHVTFVLRCRVC